MMKKMLLLLSLILLLFFVGNGWCYTINSIDVGSKDEFMGVTGVLGSESNEASWAQGVISTSNLFFSKTETVQYYQTSEDVNVFGFEITNNSIYTDYYIIKNSNNVALFKNNAKIDWAVFDIGDVGVDMNLGELEENGIFKISHVTILDDPNYTPPPEGTDPVPEPGTMILLGFGLIGLARIGRRKK